MGKTALKHSAQDTLMFSMQNTFTDTADRETPSDEVGEMRRQFHRAERLFEYDIGSHPINVEES